MKIATANDVARLAGVSRSAVSRIFSGNGFVSLEKREKILKAANQLNYRPNAMASNLASRQSNLVAIVINKRSDERSPFFYNRLMNCVQELGYFPLMVVVAPGEDGASTLRKAAAFPVHGMIVMADSVHPDAAAAIVSNTRPIVLNCQWSGEDAVDALVIDQRQGIDDMVADLAAKGHKSAAYLGGRSTALIANDRRNAFIDAMVRHGLRLVAEGCGNFRYEEAYQESLRMFAKAPLPDALFCANDIMAFGAIDALRKELGHRIPDDMSIIGYDDNPSAAWGAYDLSTIHQDSTDILDHIRSLLTEPAETPGQYRTSTKYIQRGTIVSRK